MQAKISAALLLLCATALAELPQTSRDVKLTGQFEDALQNGDRKLLGEFGKVKIKTVYSFGGVVVGCSDPNLALFFREGPIPDFKRLAKCTELSELKEILGSPDTGSLVSTSWALDDKRYDVKFWRVCSSSSQGVPEHVFIIGAVVVSTSAAKTWNIDRIEALRSELLRDAEQGSVQTDEH